MDKIEVTQNARQAAFDAYLTCYEIVPNDLWLQALLDGKHDGDEMTQAFARFERDILATRTAATSVAVEMVAELQLSAFLAGRGSIRTKANGNTHESSPGPTMDDYRRMARFALAEGWVDATPVAWMDLLENAYAAGAEDVHNAWIEGTASSEPDFGEAASDYARSIDFPPATDVAALVEAAKETNAALERDGDPAFAHLILDNKAALAPFTKGQNDE